MLFIVLYPELDMLNEPIEVDIFILPYVPILLGNRELSCSCLPIVLVLILPENFTPPTRGVVSSWKV